MTNRNSHPVTFVGLVLGTFLRGARKSDRPERHFELSRFAPMVCRDVFVTGAHAGDGQSIPKLRSFARFRSINTHLNRKETLR